MRPIGTIGRSRPVKQDESLEEEWKEITAHFLSLEP